MTLTPEVNWVLCLSGKQIKFHQLVASHRDYNKLKILYFFSAEPEELQKMTKVSDDNREEMMTLVDAMITGPATCLGAAVKAGIDVGCLSITIYPIV